MTTNDQLLLCVSRFVGGAGHLDRETVEAQIQLIADRSGKPPEALLFDLALDAVRAKAALLAAQRQET